MSKEGLYQEIGRTYIEEGENMRLIRSITDSDFFGGTPQLIHAVSRNASRGVLVNDELQVALMEMSNNRLFKLPGGGLEEGEDQDAAFLREVKEETGFHAKIFWSLGYIDEHKFRNQYMQRSYCYVAKVIGHQGTLSLTADEVRLGMRMTWMSLDDAIDKMKDLIVHCDEYSTNFMLLRDLTILEIVKRGGYHATRN